MRYQISVPGSVTMKSITVLRKVTHRFFEANNADDTCFSGSDDFKGQGNSFFGRGGRGNKKAQMRHCLRLMRSMVSTGENVVLQDFVDQGAVHQLTGKE